MRVDRVILTAPTRHRSQIGNVTRHRLIHQRNRMTKPSTPVSMSLSFIASFTAYLQISTCASPLWDIPGHVFSLQCPPFFSFLLFLLRPIVRTPPFYLFLSSVLHSGPFSLIAQFCRSLCALIRQSTLVTRYGRRGPQLTHVHSLNDAAHLSSIIKEPTGMSTNKE